MKQALTARERVSRRLERKKQKLLRAIRAKAGEPDIDQMTDFVAEIASRAGDEGFLELGWMPAPNELNRAERFALTDTDKLIARAVELNRAGYNVYVGPSPRRSDPSPETPTSRDNVIAASMVWADVDKGRGALKRALAALNAKGLQPNSITITGRVPNVRAHLYFHLDQLTPDFGRVEALNKALQELTGGDGVKNVNRLLRIRGSIAWPIKDGRVVELTSGQTKGTRSAPYSLDELRTALLSPTPITPEMSDDQSAAPEIVAIVAREAKKVAKARRGDRNNALYKAAARLGHLIAAEQLERAIAERALRAAALASGLTPQRIDPTLKSGLDRGAREPRPIALADGRPSGFVINDTGVYRVTEKGKKTDKKWLSSSIRVLALTRSVKGDWWGRQLELTDPDGNAHRVALEGSHFTGDSKILLGTLANRGFRMSSRQGVKQDLLDLLQRWKPAARRFITDRLGWVDQDFKTFVLADERVIGGKDFVFQAAEPPLLLDAMHEKGALTDWTEKVAAPCSGNVHLVTAVSSAFAAPLLELLGVNSGGLHYWGRSSRGKTTGLAVAASVWGSDKFVQSWNTTSNGLEGIAAACNAAVLCLDEVAEANPEDVSQSLYTLGNNQSKARANRFGGGRPRSYWRTMLLSSGECSIPQYLTQYKIRAKAGQQVRLLDIKATTRKHGVFDDLHDHENGAAFAAALRASAATQYGLAGPAFVARVVENPYGVRKRIKAAMASFRGKALAKAWLAAPGPVDGQVERAIERLGLIAAAGELATAWGLTSWTKGEALKAALVTLRLWIKGRGGAGAAEARQALVRTRAFIAANKDRFAKLGDIRSIARRAGYFKGGCYYIATDVWNDEIHAGSDGIDAARSLQEAGFLKKEEKKRLTHRVPGLKDEPRCYCIRTTILDTE